MNIENVSLTDNPNKVTLRFRVLRLFSVDASREIKNTTATVFVLAGYENGDFYPVGHRTVEGKVNASPYDFEMEIDGLKQHGKAISLMICQPDASDCASRENRIRLSGLNCEKPDIINVFVNGKNY